MHKIERNEAPEGLAEKSEELKNSLNNTTNISQIWSSFANTKLRKETVERLNQMFLGCCAYCEGNYETTSFPQIEHFKPKSIYPELMFEYSNMNLACQKCNTLKNNKFDEKLINPTCEEPDEHLKYENYVITALDENGEITINMFDLNSEDRIKSRKTELLKVVNRMNLIFEHIDDEDVNSNNILKNLINDTIKEVESMFENGFEYCSMYKQNFENDIEDLKKIQQTFE